MQSSPRIEELRQKFHENPRRYFAPLANEYRKAGDSQQAIAICRAHLAQQPRHMSGHVVYGQALYDAGRTEEARVVFEQALALDPENVIVLRHLGDIARRGGDVQGARDWYSRAIDLDPQDAEIAAYVAELTEPLTSVTQEAELPVTSENKPPIITRTLAELYLQQGHGDSALEIYRQLAVREPDDSSIRGRIDELVRDLEIEQTPAVETPAAATPEPAAASSEGAGQEVTEDTAEEPTEPETASLDESASLEEPPGLELTAENEQVVRKDNAMPSVAEAERNPEEAVSAETESLVSSDERHFSESDLSSEPWDADDFWGAEAFADAVETDQIFGLPYDSEVEQEAQRSTSDNVDEHESEAAFSEASASTAAGEEDIQSAAAPKGAISESAADGEMISAEDSLDSAATPEEVITGPAAESEMTDALQEVEFASATEAVISGSATDEWMSIASSVGFDEVPSERPRDETSMGPNAEDEAQLATVHQAQTDAEPQADGDAEPQAETEPAPIAPKRKPDKVPETMPETAQATEPLTLDHEPSAAAEARSWPARITVREFFATLGSAGAPSGGSREYAAQREAVQAEAVQAETAQPEAVQPVPAQIEVGPPAPARTGAASSAPEASTASESEDEAVVPVGSSQDAFSRLFSDSPVFPEDNRAAAALSGAVAHEPPLPSIDTPSVLHPAREPGSPMGRNEPPQESEEDLRRFREWLDGLTES